MGGLGDLLKGGGGGGGGGLGDLLGGILGGGSQGGSRAGGLGGNPMLRMLLPLVASLLMNGGLQKILGRLQQNGKGAKGQSWVSSGPNEPADAADIRAALDPGELGEIARQLGVSEDEAAAAVAQVLPDVVDQATPGGELPDDDELDRRSAGCTSWTVCARASRVLLGGLLLLACVACGGGDRGGDEFAIYHLEAAIGPPGTAGELRCGPPRAECPGVLQQPPRHDYHYAVRTSPPLTGDDILRDSVRTIPGTAAGEQQVTLRAHVGRSSRLRPP